MLKIISPDQQSAISVQELESKTLPKSISKNRFEEQKKEQTGTIKKEKRLEVKTNKEETRKPDDILKRDESKLPGSEEEIIFKTNSDKEENAPDQNKSVVPKTEKRERLETKTDKKEKRASDNIIKQNKSEEPETEKEKRLEIKNDKEYERALDKTIKQNETETSGSENEKRLEMKNLIEEGISENESEIPEHYLYRSLSRELNDKIETESDESCNTSIKPGTPVVLVKFCNKRNKEYRFVCRIEDISHNKIVVQGFKSKKKKSMYVTIRNDISIIEKEDIVEFLSQPKNEGNCYIFPTDIKVKEI